jgi:tripartite-type tricarboxylate transporter receptor subunit TctC
MNEGSTFTLFAPAMTPKPIVDRLSSALATALANSSVKDAYARLGYEVNSRMPDEIGAEVRRQYDLWGPFIKELNLKVE